MNLLEAIDKLLDCDGDEVLFAKRPWSEMSEAMIISLEPEQPISTEIKSAGYDYFLEAVIAKEIVEGLGSEGTPDRQRSLLIYYAENDAYPDWFFVLKEGGWANHWWRWRKSRWICQQLNLTSSGIFVR
ncbi:hypothetical protein HIV01_007830 [Lysobacter arenosi]|uniref:Uncharacterized protein n=1 Tax=Lysobacter arenosi TaxID=2795387 RepID=A0ABX7RDY8_9GAMM|nr:hypothetical protein [Lysobacter arenosi]QSX76373.1 hypothetical protein HIV01_007830 [Lysobacter arenosi]